MPPFQRVVWSPVEVEWLSKNKTMPVNQLTQALSKSQTAVKRKLAELTGKNPKVHAKKRQISKIGRRKDCDNCFLRSSWEANSYRYFKYLGKHGEHRIVLIEVEPTVFSFAPFGILRGTVSYTPDFKITYSDGSYLWIEVKGFMKRQDATKIKRFIKYFPNEGKKLRAITGSVKTKSTSQMAALGVPIFIYYNDMKKKYKDVIPNWET